MALSMTGFGRTEVQTKQLMVNIEIKSLNSKFLDLNFKFPALLRDLELQARGIIKDEIKRGKIELLLHYEQLDETSDVTFNNPLIVKYYNELNALKQKLNDNNDNNLFSEILKFPDIITHGKKIIQQDEKQTVLLGIKKACDLLNEFRKREGESITSVISEYVKNIKEKIGSIEKYEMERLPAIKHKLNKAIEELKLNDEINNKRLEQELIYYSEKIDITEEKIRLKEHCNYFLSTVKEIQCGKKLGFITQEMGREINTLGSKAHNLSIQKIVVEMKNELEKVKEQILNIL